MTHLVIDPTGFKVDGQDLWKCVSTATRCYVSNASCTLMLMLIHIPSFSRRKQYENITGNDVLPTELKPKRRKRTQVSGDRAYDTRVCHGQLKGKGSRPAY